MIENLEKFVIENSRDIIWAMDSSYKFIFVSPAVEKIRGFTPDETVGQPLSSVFENDSYCLVKSILKEKIDSGKKSFSITLELGLTHKNGDIVNTETNISAVFDSIGRLTGFFGISRDITDRKKAEKGALKIYNRFIKIIEKIPHGLLLFNNRGEIIFYNTSFKKMLGYSTEELCSKSVIQLTCEDDRMEIEDYIRRLNSGGEEAISFRSRIVRNDSHIIEVKETVLVFEEEADKIILLGIFEEIFRPDNKQN